jgi:choline dehydrogenase-like flavoprotein
VGLPYPRLDDARSRRFGGTTALWKGTCRPLDTIDFEARPGMPYRGWPFGRAHLDPYYVRAHGICQLGPYVYDPAGWASAERPILPLHGGRIQTAIFQYSPPTRFGVVFRDVLADARNVTVYLHATVTGLDSADGVVTHARVACGRAPRFAVSAGLFILAAGGIDNARLLLLSGLGNRHDLVGRFFMEHPHLDCGVFVPTSASRRVGLYAQHAVNGTRIMGVLTLAPELLRREGLLSANIMLVPERPSPVATLTARRWFTRARRRFLWDEQWTDLREGTMRRLGFPWGKRAAPTDAVPAGAAASYRIRIRAEQEPNPESRVTLGATLDTYGQPRPRLDWRLSPLDARSNRRTLEILTDEVAGSGIGRVIVTADADPDRWAPALTVGRHHMGTTRMHADAAHGVVDADCRVHGTANLLVAGSSVFPTGGHANPTLTIIALALRLADHVRTLVA